VVHVGFLDSDESLLQAHEISDEDRGCSTWRSPRRARLYLPLYPQGHRERTGAYAEFEPILRQRMDDPATRSLYHRVPVVCPGPPPVPMTESESAALSSCSRRSCPPQPRRRVFTGSPRSGRLLSPPTPA